MNIIIRPAILADASLLAKAQREIAIEPGFLVSRPTELIDQKFESTILKVLQDKQGQYLVAECEGEIVGQALLEPLHLEAICHVAHLTLVVHKGWQGRGIGKLLLEHLIDWAKASGNIEKIELHVRSSNSRAIALYKKMGFHEEGRLKNRVKFQDRHYADDILMALFVKKP